MPPDDDFQARLRAAREGAEWALVELYREVYPRVLRYLRAMQPQDAEDLASDTWIDLASGLARFRGDQGDLRAFAFTIARRRLLDLRRRNARQRTTTVEIDRLEALGNVGNVEDEALASLETGWAVALVASALPPAQAEVVLLRVLGDLSVDEVAKVVGKRPGNVRVMQHRALRRLARVLEREGVTK